MKLRMLPFFIVLLSCFILFGCAPKAENPNHTSPETTTLPEAQAEENLLPKDGYYVQENTADTVYYMHLQEQTGVFYIMNLPTEITLQDGLLFTPDSPEGVAYTYKNDKLTVEIDENKFSMKYVGTELPEKYQSILPPAGSYAVSSISVNGDMQIYGEETDEILMLSEDGTGTFLFDGTQHSILLQEGILSVDGQPIGFSYYPKSGDAPVLMLLWANEEAFSIALRPVTES